MNARDRDLLCELLGVVVDALDGNGEIDLCARVRTWLAVAEGTVKPDMVCPCEVTTARCEPGPWVTRRQAAVRLASERGALTSSALAQACSVSTETARRDLCALAGEGVLTAHSSKRGRCYTPTAHDGQAVTHGR